MAVAIDAVLLEFKNKVGGALGSMQSATTSLTSKLSSLSSLVKDTSSSVSSLYSSKNKEAVLSKFSQIDDVYKKISSSLESDLMQILNSSSALVEKVTKLEQLQKEISNLENAIAAAKAAMQSCSSDAKPWERWRVESHNREQQRIIDEKTAELKIKISEFDKLHEEAKSDLNKLKAMDSSLSFVSEFSVTDIKSLSQYHTGGEFVREKFTASNGTVIDYFLYVPKFSTDVKDLPVHLYLHGAGEFSGSETLTTSLPKQIKDGVIKPNGIVICPQGTSAMTKNNYWRDPDYSAALIELTNSVVSNYNGDSNRISISGHSQGAISAYKIISENPGYFSAFVPVSGHSERVSNTDEAWDAISDVKIWAFHGKGDTSVDYYKVEDVKEKLDKMGADNMEIYTFPNDKHSIQNKVYSGSYQYSDGVSYNPLDWAFEQTNENNS